MHKVGVIFRREFFSYFYSPIAYVIIAAFLAITGYFFSAILFSTRSADMQIALHNFSVIFLFTAPIITIRTLAEERRLGTDEFLLTTPLTITSIVIGKYLAAVAVFLVMVAVTLVYPAVLYLFGEPDTGPLLSGYLGFFLLGSSFLSVGVFASSLTEDQAIAGMIGFALMILLWVLTWAAGVLPGIWGDIARAISLFDHYKDFVKGVIDSVDVLFYLSFIFVMLFLTIRVVDKRRWS